MELQELLLRTALAVGIGLLIGFERGWRKREARPGSRTAGVRTFAISGLLGGIVAAIARNAEGGLGVAGSILLGSAFIAFAAVITVFSREENLAEKSVSATTTVAALLTFMLGADAMLGDVHVAAAAAVAAAGILIVREELHEWVSKLTLAEFESGLLLLAMTFIALPVMPDHPLPWLAGVNPREIWLIAIVLAAVSFAGYVLVKAFGERRGTLLAAVTGGLVSSTAVMLANARHAAAGEGSPRLLAAGAALATAVSFVRVMAITAALQIRLLPWVAPALLLAALFAVGFGWLSIHLRADKQDNPVSVKFRNPFGLWSVLASAVLLALLLVIGRMSYDKFGARGAISGAAIMGLFDVDAMTVAMTRLMPQSFGPRDTTLAVLTGVTSNTIGKLLMAALIGRGRFIWIVTAMSVGCVLVGGVALLLTLALLE